MMADVRQSPIELQPRPVAASVEELLAGADDRRPFLTDDSKSGSRFDRVSIGGQPHIVKYVHVDDDWTMRFFGDTGCRPLEVWQTGLMDVAPAHIDHAMVGAAGGLGRDGLGAALLMRDVSAELVPPGDEPLPLERHLQLLDGLAGLSARMWGWQDDIGLVPLERRWAAFTDAQLDDERARGWPDAVPRIARDGWDRFAERAPLPARDVVLALRRDLSPLVTAVRTTPQTFLHGDWKLGNLGVGRDGRTVLIDWTYCGAGPVCFELGWYLAINAARLPHAKEDAIEALRTALARHGVDTAGWWERQVDLCLLGALVLFGWEKALGDEAELAWWCDRAAAGARWL